MRHCRIRSNNGIGSRLLPWRLDAKRAMRFPGGVYQPGLFCVTLPFSIEYCLLDQVGKFGVVAF